MWHGWGQPQTLTYLIPTPENPSPALLKVEPSLAGLIDPDALQASGILLIFNEDIEEAIFVITNEGMSLPTHTAIIGRTVKITFENDVILLREAVYELKGTVSDRWGAKTFISLRFLTKP